ncbi:MAG: PilZ domain-containing protein [Nitrospirota bacterium]
MGQLSNYSSVTVYSSAEIKIVCPYCGANCTIINEYPPEEDFATFCTTCDQPIAIRLNLRTSYRKKVNIEAFYQIKGVNRPPRKATILDMSRGGLRLKCFKSTHEVVGGILLLSFPLPPKEEKITISAEILRVTEETKTTVVLGLRFRDLGEYEDIQIGFFLKA